ncbi:MAG: hypothetical protein AAGE01_00320 [Pseudomonadota bacterium]
MGFYRTQRHQWRDWNPGLDNDHLTLGYCLDSLPAVEASSIPWFVRLIENPSSPVALPGAITLERHDAIHVLLGRGLLAQDEAFVIGFTMGTASRIRDYHRKLFHWFARYLYRPPYRLTEDDLLIFDLGFGFGQEQRTRDYHMVPIEDFRDEPLVDLRNRLGLSVLKLHALYNHEKTLIPDSDASQRLDLDWKGQDPSALWPE